VLHKYHQNNA